MRMIRAATARALSGSGYGHATTAALPPRCRQHVGSGSAQAAGNMLSDNRMLLASESEQTVRLTAVNRRVHSGQSGHFSCVFQGNCSLILYMYYLNNILSII